jgi:predicted molibdopterin-dependent oxidoreductase YjgC
MMEKVHEQEIRALFVMGSNPLVSNPNANFVEEGLKKLDSLSLRTSSSPKTAQLADLILPVTAYLENAGTLTNLEGRVLLREAGRAAPGEAKHDWQVLCELAEKLGRGQFFQFGEVEDVFNELRLASPWWNSRLLWHYVRTIAEGRRHLLALSGRRASRCNAFIRILISASSGKSASHYGGDSSA